MVIILFGILFGIHVLHWENIYCVNLGNCWSHIALNTDVMHFHGPCYITIAAI